MPCEHIQFGDGSSAIICSDRRKPQFCSCGRPCEFLCDWKVPGRKSGTCDAPICEKHALQVGPEKHLCQWHQKAYEVWKKKHAQVAPVEPVQASLFVTTVAK